MSPLLGGSSPRPPSAINPARLPGHRAVSHSSILSLSRPGTAALSLSLSLPSLWKAATSGLRSGGQISPGRSGSLRRASEDQAWREKKRDMPCEGSRRLVGFPSPTLTRFSPHEQGAPAARAEPGHAARTEKRPTRDSDN